MKTEGSDNAFQSTIEYEETTPLSEGGSTFYCIPMIKRQNFGLTKREYFAALAMGELTKYYDACAVGVNEVAALAVQQADALIAALNQEPS